MNQISGTLPRLDHLFQVVSESTIQGLLTGAQFRIAQDSSQDIVEIVSDAARKSAKSLHLVGLPQLLFQGDFLGHVALDCDEVDGPAAFVANR